MQESSRAENQKMQEANKKLLADVQKVYRAEKLFEAARVENQKLQAAILSKIEKELGATSGKLQEIRESFRQRIISV